MSFINNLRINNIQKDLEDLQASFDNYVQDGSITLDKDVDYNNYGITNLRDITFKDKTTQQPSQVLDVSNGVFRFDERPILRVDESNVIYCDGYPFQGVGSISMPNVSVPIQPSNGAFCIGDNPILTTEDEANYAKLNQTNDWGDNYQNNIHTITFSNNYPLTYDGDNNLTYGGQILHTGASSSGMDNPATENLEMGQNSVTYNDNGNSYMTMGTGGTNLFQVQCSNNSGLQLLSGNLVLTANGSQEISLQGNVTDVKSISFENYDSNKITTDGTGLYWMGQNLIHSGTTGNNSFESPANENLNMNNYGITGNNFLYTNSINGINFDNSQNIENLGNITFQDSSILSTDGGNLYYNYFPVNVALANPDDLTIQSTNVYTEADGLSINLYQQVNIGTQIYPFRTLGSRIDINLLFAETLTKSDTFDIYFILQDSTENPQKQEDLAVIRYEYFEDAFDADMKTLHLSFLLTLDNPNNNPNLITKNFIQAFQPSGAFYNTYTGNAYLCVVIQPPEGSTLNLTSSYYDNNFGLKFFYSSVNHFLSINEGSNVSTLSILNNDLMLNNMVIPSQNQILKSTQDNTETTIKTIKTNWNTKGNIKGSLISNTYECDFNINYTNDEDTCVLNWSKDETKTGNENLTFEFDETYNLLLKFIGDLNPSNYKLKYSNDFINLIKADMTITYNDLVGTQNTAITNLEPMISNQSTRTLIFSINNLPNGLSLNTSTGIISGTPTISLTQTEYTMTITDENNNELTTTFNITLSSAIPYNTNGLYTYYNIRDNYSSGSTLTDIQGNANATLLFTDINHNVLESNYLKGIVCSYPTTTLNGDAFDFTIHINAKWMTAGNSEVMGRVTLFNFGNGNEIWYYSNSQVIEPVFPNLAYSISFPRTNISSTFKLWTFRFNSTTHILDVFLNKTKLITQDMTGHLNNTFQNINYVGHGTNTNSIYGLSLKDYMIYNRVLTDQEINDNYDDYFINRFD